MSNYGSKKSYEERKAAKKARIASHKKIRAAERKKTGDKTNRLIASLRSKMGGSHLTPTQMSDFSGVDPATIIRISKYRHPNIRLNTFVAVANACGYDVQLVKKALKDDEFKEHRLVRAIDLEENE